MNEFLHNLQSSVDFLKWVLVFLMTYILWKSFHFKSIKWVWIAWGIYIIYTPISWLVMLATVDPAEYGKAPISPDVLQTSAYHLYAKMMSIPYQLTPVIELLLVSLLLGDLAGLLETNKPELRDNAFFKILAWVRRNAKVIGIIAIVLALVYTLLSLALPIWSEQLFKTPEV